MFLIKNSKIYDVLKFVAQILLPATGTLYFALSAIWGLPYGEEIVGTLTAIDAFLGTVLMLSSSAYHNSGAKYDGTATLLPDGDRVNFNVDPVDFKEKSEMTLKVEQQLPEQYLPPEH